MRFWLWYSSSTLPPLSTLDVYIGPKGLKETTVIVISCVAAYLGEANAGVFEDQICAQLPFPPTFFFFFFFFCFVSDSLSMATSNIIIVSYFTEGVNTGWWDSWHAAKQLLQSTENDSAVKSLMTNSMLLIVL